jgi:hypothetical protein
VEKKISKKPLPAPLTHGKLPILHLIDNVAAFLFI